MVGIEVINVTDVIYDKNQIIAAIQERIQNTTIIPENIYGAGDSGEKIATVLAETELTFHKTIVY